MDSIIDVEESSSNDFRELELLRCISREGELSKPDILGVSQEYGDSSLGQILFSEGYIDTTEMKDGVWHYDITPKGSSIVAQRDSTSLTDIDYRILGFLDIGGTKTKDQLRLCFSERDVVYDSLVISRLEWLESEEYIMSYNSGNSVYYKITIWGKQARNGDE